MDTPNEKNTFKDSELHAGRDAHIGDVIYNNTYIDGKTVTVRRLLTNFIPVNAAHILGRDAELDLISKHLAENKPTVLVNGIGGIGKTSVATKYIVTHGKNYKHLAWLTVQSDLAQTFTGNLILLKELHIEQEIRDLVAAKQQEQAFETVLHHLNCLDSTLIVLDNANDLGDLVQHKHHFDTAHCHFLITSRTQPLDWAAIRIDALSPDEAVKLFKKFAPSVHATHDALKTILSKLFYHTLLIELVAKAVENAGFSFEELQTMIETKFIHDGNLSEEIVSTGTHGDSMKENLKRAKIEDYIWEIFKQVHDLGDEAQLILKAMALLPTATPIVREKLKEHLAFFGLKDFNLTLSTLAERGWLEKEKTAENKPAYKMHPLIADVVIKHLEVDVVFAEKYIEFIANFIDYDSLNLEHNFFEKNGYRAFAERLSFLFFDTNNADVAFLLDRLGNLEADLGVYSKAVEYMKRALKIAVTIFGKDHKNVADHQSNLANVYVGLRYYNEAAVLLETALESDLKNFDKDQSTVADHQSNLATAYIGLGRYNEAEVLMETALASAEKYFGKDYRNVAKFQNNLACFYYETGRKQEAKVLWQAAYENLLKNSGATHPVTIRIKEYAEM